MIKNESLINQRTHNCIHWLSTQIQRLKHEHPNATYGLKHGQTQTLFSSLQRSLAVGNVFNSSTTLLLARGSVFSGLMNSTFSTGGGNHFGLLSNR
jgi:hypothetical protein